MNTNDPLRTANRRLLDACLILTAATPVAYRTAAWQELPAEHPERYAALVRAADAWHDWWTPDARALRHAAHLDDIEQAVSGRLKDAARAIAQGRQWTPCGPSATELFRRRYPWLSDPDWNSPGRQLYGRDWHGTDHGDQFAHYLGQSACTDEPQEAA
jgi:hypothetical protein